MNIKPSILYVDDEPDNLIAFRSLFRRFFKVMTAKGGAEALKIMAENQVQLLLSDQRMPKMSGLELCDIVMQKYPQAKRIIITGYSEMGPIEEAIKTGKVAKCIRKPWDVDELKSEINNALS